jgi:hypothetical protein
MDAGLCAVRILSDSVNSAECMWRIRLDNHSRREIKIIGKKRPLMLEPFHLVLILGEILP